ncbi:MAG: precorrin-2 dehydrogenase/sirohydrochlorin ferrochelatase family protein [Planctomycetota bacterium]|jgi:precorrin-2 dehydrogenase/sirohydrochlorin ferrochelatase
MASDSNALRFLPVGLGVKGKRCLVVGGGSVGTRKALTLIRAGAIVTVVAPTVTDELAREAEAGRVRWIKDSFREERVGGAFLAIAATDDDTLNAAVARAAVDRGALVCDASSAERSEVIFGALLQHHDVTVAVFTGGRDPAQARQTRDEIARLLAETRK